jgi:protocatechuate 3,4-dioxygenase, alpha subunit
VTVGQTPSQTVGPYFALGLFAQKADELVTAGSSGAIRVSGHVLDGAAEPVPDAIVEVWQADEAGRYRTDFGWGRSGCDADGRFSFITVKPGRVANGSVEWQAPHLMLMVFARGLLKPVLTRMYFPDEEEANAQDPVLSAVDDSSSLVARPTGDGLVFDVRLQGEGETVFFAV